jgi:uncharacterized protein (DUF433 family)
VTATSKVTPWHSVWNGVILPNGSFEMSGRPPPVVHSDPAIMGGSPVFAGPRLPFQTLLDSVEAGDPLGEFLDDFPTVTRAQAIASLEQAKGMSGNNYLK